jgi:signal transduction histidine kinase
LQTTHLTLIECILSSTSTVDDNETANKARALLTVLAKSDPVFEQLLQHQPGQQEDDWDTVLRTLASLTDTSEESACVRTAANTALRLRQLQSRYNSTLEDQKLEFIYHFVYGLSHELNNPLANIASRAGMLVQSTSQPDHVQMLNAISDNAMRGCEMLGDLMLIARPPKLRPVETDLRELGRLIDERGRYWTAIRRVHFDFSCEALGYCRLDQSVLYEIVWSVLRNALEVSREGQSVSIRIWLAKNSNEGCNDELLIQIVDEGPGLSPQALQHCFDPYYSGREAGRGLGMGLAKAKRLARLHDGDVTIENRAGKGCVATIHIAIK